MPCLRCGARQTDPARGPSRWKRGVKGGQQVLVCPDCQRGADWFAELDRCPSCRSTVLVRRLGETACRDCGLVSSGQVAVAGTATPEVSGPASSRPLAQPQRFGAPGAGGGEAPDPAQVGAPGLAEDVAAALDRVLRPTGRRGDASAGPGRRHDTVG